MRGYACRGDSHLFTTTTYEVLYRLSRSFLRLHVAPPSVLGPFTVSRAFHQGGCLHYISPIPFHLFLNLGFSYSGYDNILDSTASALPKPPQTTITQPLKRRVLDSSKNPMGLVRMRELMRMCGLQSSGMVVSFYL